MLSSPFPPAAPGARNLFLEALPPLCSLAERKAALGIASSIEPADRAMTPAERRYEVLQVLNYFAPTPRHLRVSEGIDMMIRKGYEDRNPSGGAHQRRMMALANRKVARQLLFHQAPHTTAAPLTSVLLGAPGMGKTRTVELTLARYPQVVHHHGLPTQITWLKLECPKRGSVRALCVQFLTKISQLVGKTNYLELYGVGTSTEGELHSLMGLVANFHSIGILVIDEIQHIGRSHDGEHELMTFLTGLSNQLGIPLLVIGTLAAMGRIEEAGRMARRSVGLASAVWHPLPFDTEWKAHLAALWRLQWTSPPTELTDELREVFYRSTGGILDLMVKLFVSVQMRLLYRSEVRGTCDECITPEFVRNVAKVDFEPVRQMVAALVSGDRSRIMRFDDLHAFDQGFRSAIGLLASSGPEARPISSQSPASAPHPAEGAQPNHFEMVWAKLRADGLADDMIIRLMDETRAAGFDPARDVFEFYKEVEKLNVQFRKARRPPPPLLVDLAPEDLRRLVPEGVGRGLNPIEALRVAGLAGIWPTAPANAPSPT